MEKASEKKVWGILAIVFGGIAIGLGFLQWIIGFQLAVLGICFGLVATALSLQEGKHE